MGWFSQGREVTAVVPLVVDDLADADDAQPVVAEARLRVAGQLLELRQLAAGLGGAVVDAGAQRELVAAPQLEQRVVVLEADADATGVDDADQAQAGERAQQVAGRGDLPLERRPWHARQDLGVGEHAAHDAAGLAGHGVTLQLAREPTGARGGQACGGKGRAVEHGGVVEGLDVDRVVGRDRVQFGAGGQAVLGELGGVPAAQDPDPGAGALRGGAGADRGEHVVQALAVAQAELLVPGQPRADGVDVGVDQARDHPAALEVHHRGAGPGQRLERVPVAGGQDPAVAHGESLDLSQGGGTWRHAGPDVAVRQQELSGPRCFGLHAVHLPDARHGSASLSWQSCNRLQRRQGAGRPM
jgi:hypothetical protein